MYIVLSPVKKSKMKSKADTFREIPPAYTVEEAMVRTQIYLTRAEHTFLRSEASKRGEHGGQATRSRKGNPQLPSP